MSKFQKVCLVRVAQDEGSISRIYESFPIVVGRSTDVTVGVIDPGVSRAHLEIDFKAGRLTATDMGSANGTFYKGSKLESKVATLIESGDVLELGTNKIPFKVEIFEKAFDVKQVSKSDLSKDQKAKATNMLDAAHAEVQRLSWLFKAQQEQAEKATEDKRQTVVKEAQAKAAEIVAQAQVEAENVLKAGQKAHDDVVGAAESDAKKQAALILQDAGEQGERKANLIRESAEAELQKLKDSQRLDFEKTVAESQAEMRRLQAENKEKIAGLLKTAEESALGKLAEAEQKAAAVLLQAEKKAEAQQRLAEMHGEDEVRRMKEAAQIEADDLRKEAARLHLEIHTAYQSEVDRGQKLVATLKLETEEESRARSEQSQTLLKNAVEKSTKMLNDAERDAKELKSNAEVKSVAMLKSAREETLTLLEKTQADITREFELCLAETKLLRAETEDQLRDSFAKIKAGREELDIITGSLGTLRQELKDKESRLVTVEKALDEKQAMATALSENFRIAEAQLKAAQAKLEESNHQATEAMRRKGEVMMDISSRQAEWDRVQKSMEQDLRDMKAKAQTELELYRADAKTEIDRAKLEEFAHMKAVRLEEGRGIDRHRSEIVKELLRSTETHFLMKLKSHLPADFDWASVSDTLHSEVRSNLEETVYRLSHKEAAKDEAAGVMSSQVRNMAKFKRYGSITAALIVVLMAIPATRESIMEYMGQNNMHSAADKFSKEMQNERERRYAPEKTRSWKNNYTDSVLYTEGYVDMKLDTKSQDKWIKEMHSYLYGKLRVDEDSIVKIVSLEAALVTNLKTEADQIHPDYVKEKVARMRELEATTVAEIKHLVGNPTKFEKFEKFSQDFYYNEYLMRLPAASSVLTPPDGFDAPSAGSGPSSPTGE